MNYEKGNVLGYTYITKKFHNIEVLINLLLVLDAWGRLVQGGKPYNNALFEGNYNQLLITSELKM